MSNQQYKTIARRVDEEAFSAQGDLSVVDEFVSADVVNHTAPPHMQHGRENLKQLAHLWRTAFPDLTITVDDILAEGDLVAVAWTGSGTHLGDLFGIPPTGKRGVMSGIEFNRIQDGRIVERWGNNDQLGLFVQLGLAPAPANH
jgi:predicted ester cyclase